MEALTERFDSLHEDTNSKFHQKLEEMKNVYVYQIEKLQQDLEITQIKHRTLQLKYDELVAKTLDTQEEREAKMVQYIEYQAQLQEQMVTMFKMEMQKIVDSKENTQQVWDRVK